jgi:hypothetical protein
MASRTRWNVFSRSALQRHSSVQKNLVGQGLKFSVYGFDELLTFDRSSQQGFEDRKKVLRFVESESTRRHGWNFILTYREKGGSRL